MRYTIETRELTSDAPHRSAAGDRSGWTTVEASDATDAISKYVLASDAELVSLTRPGRGIESIATVRKQDSVYLVRVYAA